MKPILLFCLTMFIFIIGCEKVVNIDLEEADQKIVLSGLLCPDSSIVVDITRSYRMGTYISDDTSEPPQDKMVVEDASLYENNRLIGKLEVNNANFFELSGFKPSPGKTYRLEVSSGVMKPVSATVIVPELIPLTVFDTTRIIRNDGTSAIRIMLQISDPLEQENFYALQVNGIQQYYYDFFDKRIDSIRVHNISPKLNGKTDGFLELDFLDINKDVYLDHKLFFSDHLFNGKIFDMNFEIPKSLWYRMADTVLFTVALQQVDKSYYQYAVSLQEYYTTLGNPFMEPIQVYSNVKNGCGLFSAYNGVQRDFVVDWTQ